MTRKLLSLNDILEGEKQTLVRTGSILKGIADNVPSAIEILTQLMYFTGPSKNVNSPEGEFHSYCWHQYVQTPYSFRGCYIVWERGHYLEASIIFRSLLERFIQIRFLYKNKFLIETVWTGIRKKGSKVKKVRMKDMFENIAPGYYEKWYGQLLSGFAHSKIAAHCFRVKRQSATRGEVIMIPRFDEDLATYVINQFCPLLYGYLKFFPVFFPEGFKTIPEEILTRYNDSISWLRKCMDSHRRTHPSSLPWFKHVDKIVNP